MRVLMLDLFLPESTYTKELVRKLKKYADIDLVCTKNVTEKIDGVTIYPEFYAPGKGVIKGAGEYLHGLAFISKLLQENSYQVFHVQTFKNESVEIPFYIHLMKKHPETKFVVTAHNIAPHESPEKTRKLYQSLYDACDTIVVHNKECRKRLMHEYYVPYEKILLMPHGAYTVPEADRYPHQKGKNRVHFLFFGYLRRYKGIDVLLQAISLLPEDIRKKSRFDFIGAPLSLDKTNYIQMAEQLGIHDIARFSMRHMPEEKLPEFFNNADFCIYPYREISGSGALLMAFSYGVPVIATDLPLFKEETDHGAAGILCRAENPESLARAICSAVKMNDLRYEKMAGNARKQAEKHSWEYSAKLLRNRYRMICREDIFTIYEEYQRKKKNVRQK